MEIQSEAGTSSSSPNIVRNLGNLDTNGVQVSTKRKRALTSDVWKHFTILGKGQDGKERAACNYCSKEYVIGTSRYGTSTLNRHLSACKCKPANNDVRDLLTDHEGKLRAEKIGQSIVPVYNDMRDRLIDHDDLEARQIDQSIVREMIAMCIIEHDLPFSFVEYKSVRELFKYLNADSKPLSRHTAASEVTKIYEAQKKRLRHSLANIPSRICLTVDVWTTCTTEGYICLTAYYVDENWKLNNKILSVCSLPPPFCGIELAKKIFDSLVEWGIEKKIFSLTLDSASANDANDELQDVMKKRLDLYKSLLCRGEFFRVRCCAHIFNLIVQEGLKVASGVLYKIREGIKFVKESESRITYFEEYVQKVGVELRLDVSTQWSSTYEMLDSAIKLQRVFTSLQVLDTDYKHCLTSEEWERAENMREFIRPFLAIKDLMSGSNFPTSNLYFMHVWKIEFTLKKTLLSEDEVMKDMASRMRVKFAKYWDDNSIILAMGAVLDPRMKFKLLEFCYNKLDPSTCHTKLAFVREKLYYLFEQYKEEPTEMKSSTSNSPSHSYAAESVYEEFIAFERQNIIERGKSSLDVYLEERKLDMRYYAELDVIQYWKDHKYRYGALSTMACDLLSIPITTVACDSSFGIGARGLSKYQNRRLPKHVRALICVRNWLFGYVQPQKDGDDEGGGECEGDGGGDREDDEGDDDNDEK